MSEKRKHDRRDSIFYLKVFDQQTDELVGHIVDISEQGIMLVTKQPMEAGQRRAFRMHLPDPVESDNLTVDFEAESRWCQPEANPDLYDVGFEVIDPSPRFEQALRDLVQGYTFKSTR